jgi:calcium-dependent protein kinase
MDENANLKVIDFGTSQFFQSGVKLKQKFGTPYYIAPEVLQRSYNENCDIWSAGVNMYIVLCGYPPFSGSSDDIILKRVAEGNYSFPSPEWDCISAEAKELIGRMLTFDPELRISAQEALAHPWITNASRT